MRDRWSIVAFVTGALAFCALGLAFSHHLEPVGATVAALVGVVVAAALVRASQHHRLVRALRSRSVPVQLSGVAVRTGELGDAAFVAGLGRPTIFCDEQLPDRLTPGQLRAVLLHEQAHQRAWDPARLLLVALIAPIAGPVPGGRQWIATTLARREIAADRHALANGAERWELAAALLELPPLANAHGAGFTPAAELRLHALLDETSGPTTPPGLRRLGVLVAGGLVGIVLCAWFLHQALAVGFGVTCC